MSAAVRVESLSKKFILRHQERERYTALRDVIARRAKAAVRRLYSAPTADFEEEFWALQDVDFRIESGATVGIIGRNGAGKSTLLKILSRISEPTSGLVGIRGRVASLLEVGTGFHPELTGRENIFLNGAILGMKRAEIQSSFDEIVAFAEVEKFLDTPVKHYSSGMYMRLAFAVAAHVEPEVLIVDEVLAVGDTQFQKKCLGKMSDVANSGRTVLFVSHNMGAITSLCSKAIHLRHGRVAEIGPAQTVVANYLLEQSRNGEEKLENIRRAGAGKEARFTAARLVSSNGNSICFAGSLIVDLTILAEHDMDGLFVGCSIVNDNGVCVGSGRQETRFSASAGQPVHLEVAIDNMQLAPGSYSTALHLSRGIHQNLLDAITGYPTFHVLPGESSISWHPAWGNIVFTSARFRVR